jgi:hypothetical protein
MILQALTSIATGEVKAEAQHLLRRTISALIFALVAAVMLLFALGALLVAAYSALVPHLGPVTAALIVSAAAFGLALIALLALKLTGGARSRARPQQAMPALSLNDALQGAGPVNLAMGALILGLIVGRKL